jgi:hypothetical protein
VSNRDQLRGGVVVVVPQIVVDHLKMPELLSCTCVQCEQAVAEEIAADAIGPVVVIGGRTGGEVGDAPLFVDGDFAPCKGFWRECSDILPNRCRTVLIWLRNVRVGVFWDQVDSL